MRTVTVSASKTYNIKIGSGLLSTLGQEALALGKAASAAIVSDSNVYPLSSVRGFIPANSICKTGNVIVSKRKG